MGAGMDRSHSWEDVEVFALAVDHLEAKSALNIYLSLEVSRNHKGFQKQRI